MSKRIENIRYELSLIDKDKLFIKLIQFPSFHSKDIALGIVGVLVGDVFILCSNRPKRNNTS